MRENFPDPDNLLYQPEHPFVMGPQYVNFVIPCKPTAPHIKVELVNEEGEVKNISDKKIGLLVKFNETHDGFFTCRGSFNEKKEDRNILYEVIRTSKEIFYQMYKKIFNLI